MKFGGTSVQDAEAIARLAAIVRAARSRRPVVLVSAMSGVTDGLLTLAARAAAGDSAAETLGELQARHLAALEEFNPTSEEQDRLGRLFASLEASLLGISDGTTEAARRDALIAHGELMSSAVVAAALRTAELEAEWVDIRPLLRTDDDFSRAAVDFTVSNVALDAAFRPRIDAGRTPITQGFIGSTADGRTTTIGRGGSDYSAAILGAALRAEEVQIWTDVSGVMTTDPRVVATARPIDELSFDEAAELAYFGARVLHPATLHPAMLAGAPVRVCNARRPEDAGTLIRARAARHGGLVTAIALKRGITVVNVSSHRMLMAYGFLAKIFGVFERCRTPIDMLATSEVSVSMTIDDVSRLDEIVKALAEFGDVSVDHDQAIVCLVGDRLRDTPGVAARIFGVLREVNVSMISHGASQINIGFVVAGDAVEQVVRGLHEEFFGA